MSWRCWLFCYEIILIVCYCVTWTTVCYNWKQWWVVNMRMMTCTFDCYSNRKYGYGETARTYDGKKSQHFSLFEDKVKAFLKIFVFLHSFVMVRWTTFVIFWLHQMASLVRWCTGWLPKKLCLQTLVEQTVTSCGLTKYTQCFMKFYLDLFGLPFSPGSS